MRHITKIRFLTVLLLLVSSGIAAVHYVDANTSDGFWPGSYTSLSDAITAAQTGDEIWVAAGTYTPGTLRTDSFTLKSGVKLFGGFTGGETYFYQRSVKTNETILSGDIGIINDNSDNSYHVVSYNGTLTGTTVVDGFTIRDGNADDGSGGGGMLLENGAAPFIRNCKFVQNNTSGGGGAIYLKNGPSIEYCLFDANTASQGGAIYSPEDRNQTGDPTIKKSTFVNNIAGSGSALYFEKRETANVDSCVFWNNTNGSGTINSFSLDTRISVSSVSNTAVDDQSITATTVTNIIYYTSTEPDGPFTNTIDYILDNNHGIPTEYGFNFPMLILNIKIFLEGAF